MEHNTKECAACGSPFIPSRSTQIYCHDCGGHGLRVKRHYEKEIARSKRYQQLYAPEVFEYTCIVCEKPFKTTYKGKSICSNRCACTASKQKLRCDTCGKLLIDVLGLENIPDEEIHKRKHFCSPECKEEHEISKQPERICLNCGSTYRNSNTKFCCRNCHIDYVKTHRKPKQITPKRKIINECFICKKECEHPIRRQHPDTHVYISFCSPECLDVHDKQLQQKQQLEQNQRLKDYIEKNGMCAICDVSYKDCERMQSDFRIIPKGAKYIDNKIKVCPKFTTKFK